MSNACGLRMTTLPASDCISYPATTRVFSCLRAARTVVRPCLHLSPLLARRLHEFCLRGWVIVGKKDTCPFCTEKVPIKQLIGQSPWNPQSTMWLQILDAVRYIVVWHPMLLVVLNIFFSMSGLLVEEPHDHPHQAVPPPS